MITWCAWCDTKMGEKAPLDDVSVSHGICPPCAKRHFGISDEVIERSRVEIAKELIVSAVLVGVVAWVAGCAAQRPPDHMVHVRCPDGVKLLSVDAYVDAKDCQSF